MTTYVVNALICSFMLAYGDAFVHKGKLDETIYEHELAAGERIIVVEVNIVCTSLLTESNSMMEVLVKSVKCHAGG